MFCNWCGDAAREKWHCRKPLCRSLARAWSQLVVNPTSQRYGKLYDEWFILMFLRKMADPTTEKQREFAKRYRGSTAYKPC